MRTLDFADPVLQQVVKEILTRPGLFKSTTIEVTDFADFASDLRFYLVYKRAQKT